MKKVMNERINEIPIVFASNDLYAPYLGVALYSLIQHTSQEIQYNIHILTTEFNRHHQKRILSLQKENVSIRFIDVKKIMCGFHFATIEHITPESSYRLLIDLLFPQYEKVLYLDSDIVINRDVAELYLEEMGDAIIGAARARLCRGLVEYINRELSVPLQGYINAGILLINIAEFHKENIGQRGLQMISEKKYMTMDQDVLNILCDGRIRYIDGRWNVEWEHLTGEGKEILIDDVRKDTLSYLDDPYIVHFTSPFKPWLHPENEYAEWFWKYARETIFYEEILFANVPIARPPEDIFARFVFPWKIVKPESEIILYGGGVVGQTFLKQISATRYCVVKAICDKSPESVYHSNIPVISVSEIEEYAYDVILIAIEKESTAREIRENLLNAGIGQEKILWADSHRK